MKNKKVISAVLAVVIAVVSVTCTLSVSAKTASSASEKNPAWLSGFYVRESSTDLTPKEMVPHSNSKYGTTLEKFQTDVAVIKKLCTMNLNSLTGKFDDVIDRLYKMIANTGIIEEYSVMKDYIVKEHGIVYPEKDDIKYPVYTAVVYACLKYDIVSAFIGTEIVIPAGSTIDRAMVIIVSNVLSEEVPEDVSTIEEYAIESLKKYIEEKGYEVPNTYTPKEVITLYKIMVAEQQGYKIENKDVKNYTPEDYQHVDGSYYAAVIKMNYKVSPTPEVAYSAVKSEDSNEMAKLILTLMIESKGQSTENDDTMEKLFEHACNLGFFNLKNGFYSDVYEYDVYLKYDCKEVWLTAYSYASTLGQGEMNNIKMTMNGTPIASGKSYLLKLAGDTTKVTVSTAYDNGEKKSEAEYTFNIHNGKEKLPDMPNQGGVIGGGNTMPQIPRPEADGSGKYRPMSEDQIFSPYETSDDFVSGNANVDTNIASGSQNAAASPNNLSVAEAPALSTGTALAIVLCTAGGVILGAGGVIGILMLIKKNKGNIF